MRYIPCDLFGEALIRRNKKQTCADRVIADCYEKIRSGKQEKPFLKVILQIDNRYDMSLKQALAAQGFTGGTRGGNRTKPVGSIGKEIATVMVRYGIQ